MKRNGLINTWLYTNINKKVLKIPNFHVCLTKVDVFWLVGLPISFFQIVVLISFLKYSKIVWRYAERPDWSGYLSMYDVSSLPACSIIFLFSLLTVSPKYVSEHLFSGYLTKYVRPGLCYNCVWAFILKSQGQISDFLVFSVSLW